ncbi:hypothetical protein LguiB_026161 [Lonicera macranthoides]
MSSIPSKHLSRRFSLDEILLATNNFDDSMVIGKGGFGKVYKGNIISNNDNGSSSSSSSSSSSTTTVAIKRLNPSSKQGAPQFWTEINMLSKFQHSHVVSLIGYCDTCDEMILVYEYMVRGSLADHVQRKNHNGNSLPLSWVQRLKICIGAARGLDYLHTGTAIRKRVIHLDVKSSNILLDKDWAAKISDFGLSRIGPAEQECTHVSTTNVRGTSGYIDPDFVLTYRFTRKSDVYAFGVVLLEVLCERPALDRSLDQDQWNLAGWGQRCIKKGASHKIIGPNLKWEIFPNSLREFVQIADQCLHNCPKQRPTMSEVVAKLELALALQLHRDPPTEEYVFDNFLPVNNQENPVSYQKDDHIDKVLQLGDSSSKQISPAGENADSMKILQRKQKKGHREVELLSPIPKPSTEEPKAEEKETEKKEEPQVLTVVQKVYMHREELKKCIKKTKGVESAHPDLEGSQVTVKGVFHSEQLVKHVYKQTHKRVVIVKPDPENKKEDDKGKEEKKESATVEKKKQTGKHGAIVKPDPDNKKEEDKGKEEKKAEDQTEKKRRTSKHTDIVKPDPENKNVENKGKEEKKAEEPAAAEKKRRTGEHAAIVKPDPENKKEEDKGKEEKKAEEPGTAGKKGGKAEEKKESDVQFPCPFF